MMVAAAVVECKSGEILAARELSKFPAAEELKIKLVMLAADLVLLPSTEER